MGKKQRTDKDEVPNPNSISNRDIIQRLNFLYQASVYLNGVGGPGPSTSGVALDDASISKGMKDLEEDKQKRRRRRRKIVSTTDLSRSYIKSMKVVGQKTTVKMDPSVKRTLCKGCNIVLIPGSTATVRVKSLPSHGHAVTYTCTSCNTSRRIPAPPTLLPQPNVPVPESSTPNPQSTHPPSPSQFQAQAQGREDHSMDTDPQPSPATETLDSRQKANQQNKKKKEKPPIPHLPPLFARDVGHVVFRGNERLEE